MSNSQVLGKVERSAAVPKTCILTCTYGLTIFIAIILVNEKIIKYFILIDVLAGAVYYAIAMVELYNIKPFTLFLEIVQFVPQGFIVVLIDNMMFAQEKSLKLGFDNWETVYHMIPTKRSFYIGCPKVRLAQRSI